MCGFSPRIDYENNYWNTSPIKYGCATKHPAGWRPAGPSRLMVVRGGMQASNQGWLGGLCPTCGRLDAGRGRCAALVCMAGAALWILFWVASIGFDDFLPALTVLLLPSGEPAEGAHRVCVVGNAQTRWMARAATRRWPGHPAFFTIWGETLDAVEVEGQLQLSPGAGTSHGQGWAESFNTLKNTQERCEYILTVDEDMIWEVTEVGKRFAPSAGTSPSAVLLRFLERYRPAVTVFRWPYGLQEVESYREFSKMFEASLVQPASVFDNGCIAFHRSIVEFFIPLWLGQDITPGFTNQWGYLNFFIPLMFQQHAIQFNGIKFTNPPKHRWNIGRDDKPVSIDDVSLCPQLGKFWSKETIDWEVACSSIASHSVDLAHIGSYVSLSRSIIRDHPFVKAHFSEKDLRDAANRAATTQCTSRYAHEQRPCPEMGGP
jgi:hypothetical protein